MLVGAYCGLRLAGLRWSDVDMLQRRITVENQLGTDEQQLAPLKTTASYRTSVALLLDRVGKFDESVTADTDPATGVGLGVQLLERNHRQTFRCRDVPDEHLGLSDQPHDRSA